MTRGDARPADRPGGLRRVRQISRFPDGSRELAIETERGTVPGILHPAEKAAAGVVWLSGAQGGFNGPAGGLYPALGRELIVDGISSLRITYRRPNDLDECVLDALAAGAALEESGAHDRMVAGHSFGGAVAILAGTVDPAIRAVVVMNSQLLGTQSVGALSPRPISILHGSADERLPVRFAEDIYDRAGPPKQLVLIPGGSHSLIESAESVRRQVRAWVRETFGLPERAPAADLSADDPVQIPITGPAGSRREIVLQVGDVFDVSADAIVCPANDRLATDRAVSRRLYAIDPRPLERELYYNRGVYEPGSVVLLDLPEFPVRYLLYAVLTQADSPLAPPSEATITQATHRALATAANLGLRSMALPALGTTGARLPFERSARAMMGAIRDHLSGETTLEQVLLALPSAGVRPIYAEALAAL